MGRQTKRNRRTSEPAQRSNTAPRPSHPEQTAPPVVGLSPSTHNRYRHPSEDCFRLAYLALTKGCRDMWLAEAARAVREGR